MRQACAMSAKNIRESRHDISLMSTSLSEILYVSLKYHNSNETSGMVIKKHAGMVKCPK